ELNSNTSNIQCFFIERAKHFMSPNGVVGIIVPSSILSNSDATHIATREIVLKYFDIVSIVELGSGTFGKTGTNTVVLYLKRKSQKPEPAEHFANRVEDYFEGIKEDDKSTAEYQDLYLIKKYCEHTAIPFEEYKKLFGITAQTMASLDELFKTEIFADYIKDFENSTEIKNYKKKKIYKDKTKEEKELELNKRLIKYIYKVEKNKLLYFMLAYENKQKVLIVKSPTNNKEQKKFLGYEWSGAKGSEGIKYTGGDNLNDINTPLFNPKNTNDKTKINYLIQQNFLGEKPNDLSELEKYKDLITYANVTDILDFSRKDFNKTFSLSPKKNIVIDTKWKLVKLGEIAEIQKGKSITEKDTKKGIIKVVAGGIDFAYMHNESNRPKNTITISASGANAGFVNIWVEEIFASDCTTVLGKNKTENYYYFEILKSIQSDIYSLARGAAQPHVYPDDIKALKIPLPPKSVQEQIVKECEAIDKASEKAQKTIDKAKSDIDVIVTKVQKENKRLDEVVSKISETIDPNSENGEVNYIGLENIESNTGQLVGDFKSDFSEIKSNKTIFQKGDILYGKLRPNLNKVYKASFDGICSTDILVFRVNMAKLSDYYKYYFLSETFNQKVLKTVSGQQLPRTSWTKINSFKIPVPSLGEQKTLITKVEKLEKKISEAKIIIESATEKRQKVMDKYLK
ncbi:MAG: restriction endonuclease subunit S, partial [Sulfurimonas sp.]